MDLAAAMTIKTTLAVGVDVASTRTRDHAVSVTTDILTTG